MCDLEGLSWWLFAASAVFFTVGSIQTGEPIFLIGSLLFLAACLVFLLGHDRSRRR